MECIEARALKSSFLKEIGMKSTQQTLFEDLFSVKGIDNVVNVSTSAEFSVDDLLDFSDKEDYNNNSSGDGCFQEDYEEDEEEKDFVSNNSMISSDFPTAGELGCFPAGEVQFPVDNMESLEWLSQIVDDSLFFPPATSPAATGKFTGNRHEPVNKPVFPCFTVLGLSYPVPRNYRTKRSKKTGQGWSTTLTDSSSSSLSFSSYGSTVTSPDPVRFQKQSTKNKPGSGSSSGSSERRCSHCQVQRTPQWRTGPLGPKTLCNACGVRFKSGRLFPEYRPACSPTFSDDIHSNSHRKVLEMRKKRERESVEPEF